jgi:hypothetical protein
MFDDNDHRSPDCKRSTSLRGVCDACGVVPVQLHLPLKHHGWFCSEHCPCCNPPGGVATVPSAPTTITIGKFNGVEIAALSMDDLREAYYATSREDESLRVAIAAERRRRWSAARRQRMLVRRQRDAQRRGGVATV